MHSLDYVRFLLSTCACWWTFASIVHAGDAVRPNIVLIVADDLGYGELGCYGGTEIPTPHLDSLADSGVRFTSGYVTAPFCAASRAALMTGRYQTRFGFEFNPIGAVNTKPGIGLPVAERTLADHLRSTGYATSLVGKWHLGGTADFHPQRRGFDEFFGFLHEGHFFVPSPWSNVTTWVRRKTLPNGNQGRWTSKDSRTIWSTHLGSDEPPYDADNPILRSSQPVSESANLTDAFTREACDFIQRSKAQPFFLCLSFNAVHSPLQGEDRYMRKFSHIDDVQRRIFASMLSHLDDAIGTVIASIREQALAERTLVVFLSDNGGPTKELTSSNAPLKGGKGNLYEGGVRVPFILSWPGHLTPGVSDTVVSSVDIASTVVRLAGVASAKSLPLDGQDLVDAQTNSVSLQERSLFWRVGGKRAIRHGDWKLVRMSNDWELYNLQDDLSETHNVSARYPEIVRDLSETWMKWDAQQLSPLWN